MGVARPPSEIQIAKSDFALCQNVAHLCEAHNCKTVGWHRQTDVNFGVYGGCACARARRARSHVCRACAYARPRPHHKIEEYVARQKFIAHLHRARNCKMCVFGRLSEINNLQFLYCITVSQQDHKRGRRQGRSPSISNSTTVSNTLINIAS